MPLDDSNLVAKALRLTGRRASVHLDKQIPHGGGLGGGSADAAAVLRWAGFTDLEAAARLGADMSFCLVGGRARVRGIGEIVEPLAPVDDGSPLITPPFGCSTPAVYRAWDELGGPHADGPNDLEPAALVVEPRLVRVARPDPRGRRCTAVSRRKRFDLVRRRGSIRSSSRRCPTPRSWYVYTP